MSFNQYIGFWHYGRYFKIYDHNINDSYRILVRRSRANSFAAFWPLYAVYLHISMNQFAIETILALHLLLQILKFIL